MLLFCLANYDLKQSPNLVLIENSSDKFPSFWFYFFFKKKNEFKSIPRKQVNSSLIYISLSRSRMLSKYFDSPENWNGTLTCFLCNLSFELERKKAITTETEKFIAQKTIAIN